MLSPGFFFFPRTTHLCFPVSCPTRIPISHPHSCESVIDYFPLLPDPVRNTKGQLLKKNKKYVYTLTEQDLLSPQYLTPVCHCKRSIYMTAHAEWGCEMDRIHIYICKLKCTQLHCYRWGNTWTKCMWSRVSDTAYVDSVKLKHFPASRWRCAGPVQETHQI